jgi:hypothetical protein
MTSNNQKLCFDSLGNQICFTFTPTEQQNGLNTQLSLSGVKQAASNVGNFIQQNALPLGVAAGATALGVGGAIALSQLLQQQPTRAQARPLEINEIIDLIDFNDLSSIERQLMAYSNSNGLITTSTLPRYYTI